MSAAPHGLLVVDKPAGITSHDVVQRARRAQKTRAIGHTGTLDPFATGVMVLGLGEGLKLVAHLTEQDKTYLAEIQFGSETDSLDHTGEIIERAPTPALGSLAQPSAQLLMALDAERARRAQVPPRASAIHIGGARAHERLRRGEQFELPQRPVAVRSLQIVALTEDRLQLRVRAAKGYYVRSLARDLARRLGSRGHLRALRRERSGAFALDDAQPLDAQPMPLATALRRLFPHVLLPDDALVQALRQGKRPPITALPAPPPDGIFAGFSADGTPIALLRSDGERLLVQRGFLPQTARK